MNPSEQETKARRKGSPTSEAGFTLSEMMVVVVLIGIMLAISMRSFLAYSKSSQHKSAVRETVALLRNAQTKAVVEARTWKYAVTAGQLKIYGPIGTLVRTYTLDGNLQFSTTTPDGFPDDGSGSRGNCYFYAKGTATAGTVVIKRLDNAAVRRVTLESLTGRVSYCADPTPSTPCATP